jgi:hypothetical protein
MWTLASRIVALFIAVGYVVAAVCQEHELRVAAQASLLTLLPLALIWFPDEIGSYTGSVGRGGYVDTETPPALISFMGWFLLVGFPVVIYFLGMPHS